MVCTADDLLGWKDFPKGLRVLLFSEDGVSAAELRSKLESMEYIVYTFCNEDEALSAVSRKPESFHVAIVEVSTCNKDGSFKFLETVKHLPTIMTSNIQCLSTMMKCIALGAVEFLQKPLSEDKLRNIWQHVVHKAFNAAGGTIPESLKPIKDSVVSKLQLQIDNGEHGNKMQEETEVVSQGHENDCERSSGSDKYPAPSTPQLKQGSRLLDDGDCHDQINCSAEKENRDPDGEPKFVETTCGDSATEVAVPTGQTQRTGETKLKEEEDLTNLSKNEADISARKEKDGLSGLDARNMNSGKASGLHDACAKVNRKKTKVDWTPELHKKFVQAVEKLGIDQAIPSRILELMKVEGLTRHNVASHLQKYRLHRRHILPKEEERRWAHPKDPMQRSYYPHKPIMAFPPYHSNPAIPAGPVYPMWGPHNCHPASVQLWTPHSYPSWPPAESWHWKAYPGMHADAWGCPVMPAPHSLFSFPQNAPGHFNANPANNCCDVPWNSSDLHPAEEVIDKVVKEAINKPWLPLPLGLKPPSTESVLAELGRQGISGIPPPIGSNPH